MAGTCTDPVDGRVLEGDPPPVRRVSLLEPRWARDTESMEKSTPIGGELGGEGSEFPLVDE